MSRPLQITLGGTWARVGGRFVESLDLTVLFHSPSARTKNSSTQSFDDFWVAHMQRLFSYVRGIRIYRRKRDAFTTQNSLQSKPQEVRDW